MMHATMDFAAVPSVCLISVVDGNHGLAHEHEHMPYASELTKQMREVAGGALQDVTVRLFGRADTHLAFLRGDLSRLLELKPNWDGYGAPAISHASLKAAKRFFDRLSLSAWTEPRVVPTAAGGVQLEWFNGSRELEIEFMPDGHIEYLATDEDKDWEEEDTLNVDSRDGYAKTAGLIHWIQG